MAAGGLGQSVLRGRTKCPVVSKCIGNKENAKRIFPARFWGATFDTLRGGRWEVEGWVGNARGRDRSLRELFWAEETEPPQVSKGFLAVSLSMLIPRERTAITIVLLKEYLKISDCVCIVRLIL